MPAPVILAVPKGRILDEVQPLLTRAGIRPEPAFFDENSRALQFKTDRPDIELIRVRAFDVATFVAHGAAQLGIVGSDVLMEFDYSELYTRPSISASAIAASRSPSRSAWRRPTIRANGATSASRPNIRTSPASTSRRAACRPSASS